MWDPGTGAELRGLWVTIWGVIFSDNSSGVGEAGCVRGVGGD